MRLFCCLSASAPPFACFRYFLFAVSLALFRLYGLKLNAVRYFMFAVVFDFFALSQNQVFFQVFSNWTLS